MGGQNNRGFPFSSYRAGVQQVLPDQELFYDDIFVKFFEGSNNV